MAVDFSLTRARESVSPTRPILQSITKHDVKHARTDADSRLQYSVDNLDILALIKNAFDEEWYRRAHEDILRLGVDPFEHYIQYGRAEGRAPTADFSPAWYTAHYLANDGEIDPFTHYVTVGREKGNLPNIDIFVRTIVSSEFNTIFYLKQNADVAHDGIDPVQHYIETGAAEGRNPHPDFDTLFYLETYADVRKANLNPFFHYLAYGRAEQRRANSATGLDKVWINEAIADASDRRIEAQIDHYSRVYKSSSFDNPDATCLLFDASWYWNQAQRNSAHSDMAPLDHYRSIGWAKGHWPHPLFDPLFYAEGCTQHGIVLKGDPLKHYHGIGARSGISPHRLFDHQWYAGELLRIGRPVSDASLTDYLYHGGKSGLDPHPLFSTVTYNNQTQTDGLTALHHFVVAGWCKRLSTHVLFDIKWYLRNEQALQAFQRGIDPLTHYIVEGSGLDLSSHSDFDPIWYRKLYCPPSWSRSTLEHFIVHGSRPSARMSAAAEYDFKTKLVLPSRRDTREGPCPLVSVIIVNWNGAHHLDSLFGSLRNQTYLNFEVIFVDNASDDRSLETVRGLWPSAKIVALNHNAGFAEANNLGYEVCRGELISLLNNDTKVDANWLGELVASIGRYPEAGAATSRVRFWCKFRSLIITSGGPFALDYAKLLLSLQYKKCIVTQGSLDNGRIEASKSSSQYVLEVKVPEDEAAVLLGLTARDQVVCWLSLRGKARRKIDVDGGYVEETVDLRGLPQKHAHFVINNAGSHEPSWLATADIGFGDFDLGQHGREREVALACGCAMILRRAALRGTSIFMADFIAYFEDSELSRRLRKMGHSIIYSPGAIVYHKHSSTTSEHSPFWTKQIRRNQAIYNYLGTSETDRHAYLHQEMLNLNHYHTWLKRQGDDLTSEERSNLLVLPSVMKEIKQVCATIDAGKHLARAPCIGVFNRFWATLGGGEAHALFIASYLARYGHVDLISESDFDLDEVAIYFNVNAERMRKRIVGRLTTATTAEYDVFVNSAYQDETPSRAKHSFFIVSFPSRAPSEEFLRSYTFLANSGYTSRWIDRWWGYADPDVRLVEPIVSDALLPTTKTFTKAKVMLSVGRFFTTGHSKNQLEIVRAFKAARLEGWTLKLAGSIGEQAYFDAVEAEAEGAAVELHPNASFDKLKSLYAESAIYVHASGLGRSQEDEPENFEHFGMTVAEAVANGCLPVVFNSAGPADIVSVLGHGLIYQDEADLTAALLQASRQVGRTDYILPSEISRIAATLYTRSSRVPALETIIKAALA